MTTIFDPYSVLDVAPGATALEIRKAFRKAALRYHPDLYAGDLTQAEAEFRRLVDAYHHAMQDVAQRRAIGSRAMSPQELARLTSQPAHWDFRSIGAVRQLLRPRQRPLGTRLRSIATINEPSVFKWIWAGALAAGSLLAFVFAVRWMAAAQGLGDIVWAIVATVLVYAGILVAGLTALVLSRRVVYLIDHLRRREALPSPHKLSRFWRRIRGK